ncbi:MAG: amidohydrolase family protein [Eubacteriales bacterium]|nr:amidohydrolase family protein [Eubacteriales bacterium]
MYDFIIKNGLIVDGTGRKPFKGSVLVKDGIIERILPEGETTETEEAAAYYDACGHVVAPGFINLHCHSDETYVKTPTYESMLRNGVTFEFCGQCGLSCIPYTEKSGNDKTGPSNMEEYIKAVNERGVSINVGMCCGHGALRSSVIGWEQRPLTDDELREMCELFDKELKAGALGVSFGLIYPPGSFCDRNEIKALAEITARNDKVMAVHMRNENVHVFEALDEMIEIANETGVRLEISHLKLMGKSMWGRAGELLKRISLARAKGVRIQADQYPYDASHSRLTSSLPDEALDGGYERMVENLKNDEWWDIISEHGTVPKVEQRGGAENIVISETKFGTTMPWIIGKSLKEIADTLGVTVAEAMRQILIASGGNIMCVYHNMSYDDIFEIMKQRDISVVSDGTAYDLNDYEGKPHPRNAGTFARFLRLVRENSLMPLEDAIFKITALPSSILKTDDRFGMLREGLDATITVFDFDSITDHATYDEPAKASTGVDYVFVNGELVLDHDRITDARPGRVITR